MNAAHLTQTQIMAAFAQAVEAAGMVAPIDLVPDGKLHRFDPDGRGNGRNGSGWYALHLDGVPAGIFGDWRAGLTQTWCSKATSEMTQGERDEWRATIRACRPPAMPKPCNASKMPPGWRCATGKPPHRHGLTIRIWCARA